MTLLNQVKEAVGIDPYYDVSQNGLTEVLQAKAVFMAALVGYMRQDPKNKSSEDEMFSCALSEVWHAAKQYYAQHPDKLHRIGFV